MHGKDHGTDTSKEEQRRRSWPYASLLVFGYFGASTAAGKALVRRTTVALAVVVIAGFALPTLPGMPAGTRALLALAMLAGVVAIIWANGEYVGQLDDLERRIQLEAMAFSYGFVMILAFAFYAFTIVQGGSAAVNPALLPIWLILAEPIRGLKLVQVARRYE